MKNNFDLRKFLTENKLTINSRLLKEEVEMDVPDMNNPEELDLALDRLGEIISDNFAPGNGRYSIYDGVEEVASVLSSYYGPEHREFIEYAMTMYIEEDPDMANVLKAAFNIVTGTKFKFDLSGIEFEEEQEDEDRLEKDFITGQKYFKKYRDRIEKEGLLDGTHSNWLKFIDFAQELRKELQKKGEIKSMELFIRGFLDTPKREKYQ